MNRIVDWKPVLDEASKAEEVGGDMPLGTLATEISRDTCVEVALMACNHLDFKLAARFSQHA